VQVTDPTGKVILDQTNWARHNGKMPSERSVILADPVLDLLIESSDPAGRYRISASASGLWELDVGR
jgi:hypothetical protein